MFRLLAVWVGLAPFVLAETALRMVDWGRPADYGDPFVGFSAVHPLFVLDDSETRYEIPRARQAFFRPESFPANKDYDEYRIFCLGGSTVQGRPFAIETSFTTWLELSLNAADSQRDWNAVNCGGVSYASYRLLPILEEVLGHAPDLVIVYTGQNEFLEDRTYGHIKRSPAYLARPLEMVSQLRTFTLLREGYHRVRGRSTSELPGNRPVLKAEVDALLDYHGGLKDYHRDDKWRRDVVEHFGYNLHRMVELTREAGIPLLLVNPATNLRDCPPFKVEHRAHLTTEQRRRFASLWTTARKHYRTNKYQAAEYLKQAIEIDDRHAGIYYDLANCYFEVEMTDQAHKAYVKAKDLDVCPLRITEPMHEAVFKVARQTDTPLVDVRELFEGFSRHGIPGSDWLIDHVHPTIEGHQRIAGALADELVRQGIVRPSPSWEQDREARFREHLASLDDFYYAKAMQRLDNLRQWSKGRADRVRPKSGGMAGPAKSAPPPASSVPGAK